MKLPDGAKTIEEGIALIAARHAAMKAVMLKEIDDLAKSGFADQRWCAIARTDIEKGFLSLNQALPTARDGRDYGKQPVDPGAPLPAEFVPPVDTEARRVGNPPAVEWQDYDPRDGT